MRDDIQELWRTQDKRLETSLRMNLQLLETVGAEPLRASFRGLIRRKVVGVVIGGLWAGLLLLILFHHHSEPVFVACLGAIVVFTLLAIVSYIQQIALIREINLEKNITDTQSRLARLEDITIQGFRIQFLQAPAYSCWFVTRYAIRNGGLLFLTIVLGVSLLLALAGWWMYKNIVPGRMDRKWVKALIRGENGDAIARTREFIAGIEEFRKEI